MVDLQWFRATWILLVVLGCVFEQGETCFCPSRINHGQIDCSSGQLKITCDEGFYLPAAKRSCRTDSRRWFEKTKKGWRRMLLRFACKAKRCPTLELTNGYIFSTDGVDGRNSYGAVAEFECSHGFTLYGSKNRTCQSNYRWSGTLQTCQNTGSSHDDVCMDPGIPAGATADKSGLKINDKVVYTCSDKLVPFGDSERTCQPDGRWSGTPFACYDKKSFDYPEEVALGFAKNLDELKFDTCNHDNRSCLENYIQNCEEFGSCDIYNGNNGKGRRKRFLYTTSKEEGLDIYVALDNSASISKQQFKWGKQFVSAVIQRLGVQKYEDRHDPGTRFEIKVFNDSVYTIANVWDVTVQDSTDLLEKFDTVTGSTVLDGGTNIPKVLDEIYTSITTMAASDNNNNIEPRKVIVLLLTDGASNIGGDPSTNADKIKDTGAKILGIHLRLNENSADLDVMKKVVSPDESQRKYYYSLKTKDELNTVLKTLLNTSIDYSPCGIQEHSIDPGAVNYGVQSRHGEWPWMAQLKTGVKHHCGASILTNTTLLTAAHCFFKRGTNDRITDTITVHAGHLSVNDNIGKQYVGFIKNENVKIYPGYDNKVMTTAGKDIAIIKLEKPIKFTSRMRPICVEGFNIDAIGVNEDSKGTSAIAGWGGYAGNDGQKHILRHGSVNLLEKCENEQFLCAGETGNLTCPGDSGGPLMKPYKTKTGEDRFFEIGIVSYGDSGTCANVRKSHFTKVSTYIPWIKNNV